MDRLGEIGETDPAGGWLVRRTHAGDLTEMHNRIPGSQLAIIEDASHLCFTEQPAVFTSLVNTFLDRQEATAHQR